MKMLPKLKDFFKKKHKILTLEEAYRLRSFRLYSERVFEVFEYKDGYGYGQLHLIEDGIDLLAGLKATYCYWYKKQVYKYRDEHYDMHHINIFKRDCSIKY